MLEKKPIEDLYLDEKLLREATVITEGKKSWTFRAHNLIFDKQSIKGIAEADRNAARIFIAGELPLNDIGPESFNFLIGSDDVNYKNRVYIDPLFERTRHDTIRMTRFDPKFVWPCINPEVFIDLAETEAARLGLDMDVRMMEHYDFYESMVHCMKVENGDFCVPALKAGMPPSLRFCVTYLMCLLLFWKPGYMGVPVAEFFSDSEALGYMKFMEWSILTEKEQKEIVSLRERYGKVSALTGPEIRFIINFFDKSS